VLVFLCFFVHCMSHLRPTRYVSITQLYYDSIAKHRVLIHSVLRIFDLFTRLQILSGRSLDFGLIWYELYQTTGLKLRKVNLI